MATPSSPDPSGTSGSHRQANAPAADATTVNTASETQQPQRSSTWEPPAPATPLLDRAKQRVAPIVSRPRSLFLTAWDHLRSRITEKLTDSRDRLRDNSPVLLRLLLGSVLTYLVIQLYSPGSSDMTGPLTALLILQASIHRTFFSAVDRVLAVLAGIGVAILVTSYGDLNWLTLAIVIGSCLAIGYALDFADNRLEIPISGMLILGAAQHGDAAELRIINTLVGTAAAVAIILLFPLRPRSREAVEAVADIAHRTADQAESIARSIESDFTPTQLMRTINLAGETSKAREAVSLARRDHLLNISAVGAGPHHHPKDLLQALDSLEGTIPQLQRMVVNLDSLADASALPMTVSSDGYPGHNLPPDVISDLRGIHASAAEAIASALRAFGDYFVARVDEREQCSQRLDKELVRLSGTRAMLTELSTLPGLPDSLSAPAIGVIRNIASIERLLDVASIGEFAPMVIGLNRWVVAVGEKRPLSTMRAVGTGLPGLPKK